MSDPELAREVLIANEKFFAKGPGFQRLRPWLGDSVVLSEGQVHRRQRRLLQPSFHKARIENYARIMGESIEGAVNSLHDGDVLSLSHFAANTAFAAATGCMFSGVQQEERSAFMDLMQQTLNTLSDERAWSVLALFKRWTGQLHAEQMAVSEELHDLVDRIIENRRNDPEDHGDLLSMLLSALDEEGDGKGLTNEEVRNEIVTLMVAGYETVASALTTTLYQLSQDPDAESLVLQELQECLGGRVAGFSDAPLLHKTQAAFFEALRLFPAAWIISRRALEPVELGGHTIPRDATVMVSPYVIQRNPRFFPNPDQYDLARWTPDKKASLPKFAYFPFGAGSRVCIGEQFAIMEATIFLSAFLQRWRIEPAFPPPMPYRSTVTLRPSNGCPVTIRRR